MHPAEPQTVSCMNLKKGTRYGFAVGGEGDYATVNLTLRTRKEQAAEGSPTRGPYGTTALGQVADASGSGTQPSSLH